MMICSMTGQRAVVAPLRDEEPCGLLLLSSNAKAMKRDDRSAGRASPGPGEGAWSFGNRTLVLRPHLLMGDMPRGVAQSGSAFGWGPKGRWFESSRPD